MVKNQASRELPLDQAEVEQQKMKAKLPLIANILPHFTAQDAPKPLSGGLLNYVWRINGQPGSKPRSLIAKWAPHFIASSPEVQLDPGRLSIEAKVLDAFRLEGKLTFLSTDKVRPPHLIKFIQSQNLLLMEDVYQCPDLAGWINEQQNQDDAIQIGSLLGDFIGRLHRFTHQHPEIGAHFDNQKIQ